MDILVHSLNNQPVCQRSKDGYINGTNICKIANKKISHWKTLDSTIELLQALETDAGIPASVLIQSIKGGLNQGT